MNEKTDRASIPTSSSVVPVFGCHEISFRVGGLPPSRFNENFTKIHPIRKNIVGRPNAWLYDLINEVIEEVGATAITITHDMESARKIADRISMLYEGSVIWSGDASDINNSNNPYVDQFINGNSDGPIKINLHD